VRCCIRASRCYIVPRGGGVFMIGATTIEKREPAAAQRALDGRAA
jgi:glycine/D-amino acid oxidase-like deaminating enzyme